MSRYLSDIAELFNGKTRPTELGKYPVFGGNGLIDYTNDFNSSDETIIIGRVGAYCGNVNYYKGKCWVTDNAIGVHVKSKIDMLYLYYKLISMKLARYSGGSSQPLMTQARLSRLRLNMPTVEIQEDIVNKIKPFDDKIKNNDSIILNLKEYSQILFYKWFVDFNFPDKEGKPYKNNGGKIYKKDKKSIPLGWTIKNMYEIADFKNGLNYSADITEKPNAKIISVTQLTNYFILSNEIATDFYLRESISDDYLIKKYNTIIARSASPGECSIALDDLDAYYSGFSIRIKPIEEIYKYFIFFNTLRLKKLITSNSDGTIIKNITQQNLKRFEIITPNKDIIREFNDKIEPILLKIQSLNKENQILEETRDLLMKKLIK